MHPIIYSSIIAVVGTFIIGKFTKFWVYNGSHSIIGYIVLVVSIYVSIIHSDFTLPIAIAMGCLLSFGFAMLMDTLGRSFDKYSVNTHLTVFLLILGISFIK